MHRFWLLGRSSSSSSNVDKLIYRLMNYYSAILLTYIVTHTTKYKIMFDQLLGRF